MTAHEAVAGERGHVGEDVLAGRRGDTALEQLLANPRSERCHATCATGTTHCPAQLGSFARLQPAGAAQLDHLVLEEHHAQRVRQHRFQQRATLRSTGIADLLRAATASQVGLHHAALDRTGSDQGHRHRQVVERTGLQHGETGAHLGPGFQLEDTDRVASTEGVEDGRVVAGEAVQLQLFAGLLGDRGEAALNDRQHREAQQIDLGQARQFCGILVPLFGRNEAHQFYRNEH
jgi:hypothetical protein